MLGKMCLREGMKNKTKDDATSREGGEHLKGSKEDLIRRNPLNRHELVFQCKVGAGGGSDKTILELKS